MIKQLAFQQEASVFCHSPQRNIKSAEEGSHFSRGKGGQLFVTFSIILSQLKPKSHYFPTAYQRRVFADAAQGDLITPRSSSPWQPLHPGGWLNGRAQRGAGCEISPLCQIRLGCLNFFFTFFFFFFLRFLSKTCFHWQLLQRTVGEGKRERGDAMWENHRTSPLWRDGIPRFQE